MQAASVTDPDQRSERRRLRQTAAQIGAELQSLLETVVESPVPKAWLELLRRADELPRGRA